MLKQFEDKMQKSLDSMANDFMTIRAGRANPHVLDKVKVLQELQLHNNQL